MTAALLAVSTLELTLRMVVGLTVVVGLLWLATRTARNRLQLGGQASVLEVCHRQQLTRSATVALVRSGRRHFLIGVNDGAITLLADGDELATPPTGPAGSAQHRVPTPTDADPTDPGPTGPSGELEIELGSRPEPAEADRSSPQPTLESEPRSGRSRIPVGIGARSPTAGRRRPRAPSPTTPSPGLLNSLRERTVRRP